MNQNNPIQEIFARLAAPFEATDIEWRAGATNSEKTRALALAYITSRAVMERLDEVVKPENWCDEYKPGPDGGVICGLSLRIQGEWITKWDGAENTDFEAIKGGLSDAFKRAGVKWGIGRYLYKIPASWVACETHGKSVSLKSTPALPAWALPQPPASVQTNEIPVKEPPAADANLQLAPAPPGNGTTPSNGKAKKSWSAAVVDAVIQAGLAPDPVLAVQLLNASELENKSSPEQVLAVLKKVPVLP